MHVSDRSENTLIPLIQRWVAPGTTIHSDGWGAYNDLSALGFDHHQVNHSRNYVDPQTGVTTNYVEAFWSRIKRRLKYITGSQEDMRWSHLDGACYRHWYGFKGDNIWENIDIYISHLREFNSIE